MTSGQFKTVPVESIHVDEASRQRRELENIDVLADSIRRLGLIHPIVIDRESQLVAGRRRLAAVVSLGWDTVTVQYVDTLDPAELYAIELEENIKRQDISWQDQCRAVMAYHDLRSLDTADWTQGSTAEALGLDAGHISSLIKVAKELARGTPLVVAAPAFSVAKNVTARVEDRRKAGEKSAVAAAFGTPAPTKLIIEGNFNDWAKTYSGPKFNLIHCDFPYGIGADKFDQGGAAQHGGYEDTVGNYLALLQTMEQNLEKFVDESAHLIFWFSMKHYELTLTILDRMGWDVDIFPLIWHRSDNSGILPDPNRGPRRTYETAFFASRGDRRIVRAVANSFACPTVKDRHMSEKPQPMLEHFFRMVCDEHTRLLDPTAGSGSAIRAGKSLGAQALLGLELNPEYVERANLALGG